MERSEKPEELYCNMNMERSLFSADCSSDSTILFVQGTVDEVSIKIKKLINLKSLQYYTSLRVRVKGTVVHKQNTCCLLFTIFFAASLVLPLILVYTEWWKKKALMLSSVRQDIYGLVGELLEAKEFEQVFLCVEDNFLSQHKMEILLQGLRKSKTKNCVFQNKANNFDIENSNASRFQKYCIPFMHDIENTEFKWGKTVFSNLPAQRGRL